MLLGLEIWVFCFVASVYLLGGYVKGAVGFALPMISVAGGATVLDAQTAVATMILPVILTNILQAFREGVGPLLAVLRRFWMVIVIILGVIAVSAPLLVWMPDRLFFATLGVGVGVFGALQLAGWRPEIRPEHEKRWGVGVGVLSGFYGGVAGIWGPPYIFYLTALKLPKEAQVRAAGAAFLAGSLVITPAHVLTGVLSAERAMLSAAMVPVAVLGMFLGQRLQDRMDQNKFRRLTLIVLLISSVNLLRRAIFG